MLSAGANFIRRILIGEYKKHTLPNTSMRYNGENEITDSQRFIRYISSPYAIIVTRKLKESVYTKTPAECREDDYYVW